jgi:ribosomal protein S18 acetylase RimI-like enzyme
MIIRKAKEKDLEELSSLQERLMKYHSKFDRYYSVMKGRKDLRDFIRKCLRSRRYAIFVAEDSKGIVGFIQGNIVERPKFFKNRRIGGIGSGFILEKYRGRGINKMLTDRLFEWFLSKGIRYVELSVDIRNSLAIKAWKKCGFEGFQVRMKKEI